MSAQEVVDYIKKEWGVLGKAPFSFIGLSVLFTGAGFGFGMLYYSSQVGALREQLNTKDAEIKVNETELGTKNDQISRYQVVLGIKPGSPGALVELNNKELSLKAQSVVAKLRQYQDELKASGAQIEGQVAAGKLTMEQSNKESLSAIQKISEEFDNNEASDAYNVENELRSRLSPEALSHIVMVPGFILKDSNGNPTPHSRITFSQLMRGPSEVMYLGRLADEIDQMAKLLPLEVPKQ